MQRQQLRYWPLLAVLAVFVADNVYSAVVIKVTNGERDGNWGPTIRCPSDFGDYKAVGFATQNDRRIDVGPLVDKTGLNSIALFCNDPDHTNITSLQGEDGEYGREATCASDSYLVAFQLRVLSSLDPNVTDKTAANDIKFKCSNDREISVINGNNDGEFGDYSEECPNGICGIQTLVEPTRPIIDNTALNDVRFECCA